MTLKAGKRATEECGARNVKGNPKLIQLRVAVVPVLMVINDVSGLSRLRAKSHCG